MNLREIKRTLKTLNFEQLQKLNAWLLELIATERAVPARAVNNHPIMEARRADHRNYRLEGVRCGKKGCKCADGQLHGPYWYCYWTEGGRTKSQYIGKKLPRGVGRRLSRAQESDNLR